MSDVAAPVRCAGVDGGSARIGLAIADYWPATADAPARARVVALMTIPVGRLVPRPKPITITRRDGSTRTYSHRREVTPEHRGEAAGKVMAELLRYGVERLTLETVFDVHMSKGGGGAGSAMATANMHAQAIMDRVADRVSERVSERVAHMSISVDYVRAVSWRSRVTGTVAAKDADVETAVAAHFENWPAESTRDQRDAAGALLWSVLPRRAKKPRAPSSRKPRLATPRADASPAGAPEASPGERAARVGRGGRVARAAERARRVALGCTCAPRGRHREGCPLARDAGGAPRCAVCGKPRVTHERPCAPAPPSTLSTA